MSVKIKNYIINQKLYNFKFNIKLKKAKLIGILEKIYNFLNLKFYSF